MQIPGIISSSEAGTNIANMKKKSYDAIVSDNEIKDLCWSVCCTCFTKASEPLIYPAVGSEYHYPQM